MHRKTIPKLNKHWPIAMMIHGYSRLIIGSTRAYRLATAALVLILNTAISSTAIAHSTLLYSGTGFSVDAREVNYQRIIDDIIAAHHSSAAVAVDHITPLRLEKEGTAISPPASPTTHDKATHSTEIAVAIIIDDIGYNYAQGLKAMQLPGNITYAIIPHSPKATFFAQQAEKHQKETMLHAPMSTINHLPIGDYGLNESMSEGQFKSTLQSALSSLPNVKGLNNHMGSLLTQKNQPMAWVMEALKERQLYFVDSRTSAKSVAWDMAQQQGIPALKRDIFLDHEPNKPFIHRQFQQLILIAKRQGYAVAIAHPHPETIAYLEENLSVLASHNIRLVTASTLAKRLSPRKMSPKIAKTVMEFTKKILPSTH